MSSAVQTRFVMMLFLLSGVVSCSNQDNTKVYNSYGAAKPAFIHIESDQVNDKVIDKDLSTSKLQHEECVNCSTPSEPRTQEGTKSNLVHIRHMENSLSREIAPEQSTRSGNTITQTAGSPSDDLDLVQLPTEDNYQAVNSIWTSELPQDAVVMQSAEYNKVIFNQLSSPNSLHTVNSVRHDDNSKRGSIKQSFKLKDMEMIQRSTGNGVHSVNYFGE